MFCNTTAWPRQGMTKFTFSSAVKECHRKNLLEAHMATGFNARPNNCRAPDNWIMVCHCEVWSKNTQISSTTRSSSAKAVWNWLRVSLALRFVHHNVYLSIGESRRPLNIHKQSNWKATQLTAHCLSCTMLKVIGKLWTTKLPTHYFEHPLPPSFWKKEQKPT